VLAAGDDLDGILEERLRFLVAPLHGSNLSKRDPCRRT
jgi:hypothetical protein